MLCYFHFEKIISPKSEIEALYIPMGDRFVRFDDVIKCVSGVGFLCRIDFEEAKSLFRP
jgi:hypothetical protein